MTANKSDIIARLQREILPLQGYKPALHNTDLDVELGPIKNAFPNAVFSLGAVHEFIYTGSEDAAATGGFVSGILGSIMRNGGASIWINSSGAIFPPFKSFWDCPSQNHFY